MYKEYLSIGNIQVQSHIFFLMFYSFMLKVVFTFNATAVVKMSCYFDFLQVMDSHTLIIDLLLEYSILMTPFHSYNQYFPDVLCLYKVRNVKFITCGKANKIYELR